MTWLGALPRPSHSEASKIELPTTSIFQGEALSETPKRSVARIPALTHSGWRIPLQGAGGRLKSWAEAVLFVCCKLAKQGISFGNQRTNTTVGLLNQLQPLTV